MLGSYFNVVRKVNLPTGNPILYLKPLINVFVPLIKLYDIEQVPLVYSSVRWEHHCLSSFANAVRIRRAAGTDIPFEVYSSG